MQIWPLLHTPGFARREWAYTPGNRAGPAAPWEKLGQSPNRSSTITLPLPSLFVHHSDTLRTSWKGQGAGGHKGFSLHWTAKEQVLLPLGRERPQAGGPQDKSHTSPTPQSLPSSLAHQAAWPTFPSPLLYMWQVGAGPCPEWAPKAIAP